MKFFFFFIEKKRLTLYELVFNLKRRVCEC